MQPFRLSDGISLSFRLKLLSGLWIGLATLSVVLTLILSQRLENAASVIEEAGNLRMQTYRMAYMAGEGAPPAQIDNQIAEFQYSLNRIAQSNAIHPLIPSETPLAYDLIQSMLLIDWQANILPSLQKCQRPTQVELYRFAGNIELFLQALENANEKNNWWLRRFQSAIMLMTLISALLMLRWNHLWVIRPLNTLRDGAERIGQGDFDTPIPDCGTPEFRQVGQCFNQMGKKLKILYGSLEEQVAAQTKNLARQNQNLTLLYQTTSDLHLSFTPQQAAEQFLNRIIPAFDAAAGSIVLTENGQSIPLAAVGNTDLKHSETRSIRYQNDTLGKLTLFFSDGIRSENTDRALLDTLIGQLGISLASARQEQEKQLLAVLQERNLIAQGLHDSIAQALTFLNLQVQMLETAFAESNRQQVEENIGFIKTGVQECYEDVRELLLNFRTKISNKDFPQAVADLLDRFEQQTGTSVETVWEDTVRPPAQDEQLQLIFILQESLSNIRKHARARHVKVSLLNRSNRFIMKIEDDGEGFDIQQLDRLDGSHVGLHIMQERAKRIHAELEIQSRPQQGTTIQLTAAPQESLS